VQPLPILVAWLYQCHQQGPQCWRVEWVSGEHMVLLLERSCLTAIGKPRGHLCFSYSLLLECRRTAAELQACRNLKTKACLEWLCSSRKQKMAQGHGWGRAVEQSKGWGTGCCTSNQGTCLSVQELEELLCSTACPTRRARVPWPHAACSPCQHPRSWGSPLEQRIDFRCTLWRQRSKKLFYGEV